MFLARLLAGMDDHDHNEPSARATPPDVLCITLREVAARYAQPCPFKAGDLVTPKVSADIKGASAPHIVLEVLAEPHLSLQVSEHTDGGSNNFGRRIDMRVANESFGRISAYWVESYQFELYAGPDAGRETVI